MIDIDYRNLPEELESGLFRTRLREALAEGFQKMHDDGERLPPASHYASRIAGIIGDGAPAPFESTFAYELYQEILGACEGARASVLGENEGSPE